MIFNLLSKLRESEPQIRTDSGMDVNIHVVGVGGGGGNAVRRMVRSGLRNVNYLVLNTDTQALRGIKGVPTFAIGPDTTNGMGSGGQPDVGRRAMRESRGQVSSLLEDADMVFVAAGLGGGTGTGAAALVADLARKRGALTVGVVTLPFGFEGPKRRLVAEAGLLQLRQKVDTLIVVENDRLLPALDARVELDRAFNLADRVLHHGVQGISDIVTVEGLINVDFADVKAVMANGGAAFMAVGRGEGRDAAIDAARSALENPLFDVPLEGATGVLFNVRGGPDLTLGQVHEVADFIGSAASSDANVIFGVVQDKSMKRSVSVTLVGTGVARSDGAKTLEPVADGASTGPGGPSAGTAAPVPNVLRNGHAQASAAEMIPLL